MPYIENKEDRGNADRKYIVTHGKYTIMGSFNTAEEANVCLAKVAKAEKDEKFITAHIQSKCETEMERFWPLFGARLPNTTERRFQCVGWKGTVLAKIKTNREFRSAVTFARDGVIYVIPGKVSNIFDAERETIALINNQNVLQQGAYQYVKNGTLHDAMSEITEAIDPRIRNTCTLQTYAELTASAVEQKVTPPESKKNSFSKSEPSILWLSRKDVTHTPVVQGSNSAAFFQPQPGTPSAHPKTSSAVPTTSHATPTNYKIQIRSSL
jgi:hypothetical protein